MFTTHIPAIVKVLARHSTYWYIQLHLTLHKKINKKKNLTLHSAHLAPRTASAHERALHNTQLEPMRWLRTTLSKSPRVQKTLYHTQLVPTRGPCTAHS